MIRRLLHPCDVIVARLAPVAERAARRSDFQWEVTVINDPKTVNAFVLPGGKIGVYTGIFPVAQTEAGMAIILGHEMGHAIARHAAERLSHQLGAQLVGTVLAAGIQGSAYGDTIMAAFGLGAQVGVLLPYSRLQEEEADRIGLVLAAQAGYDPRVAVGVWERMAKLPGQRPPRVSLHAPRARRAHREDQNASATGHGRVPSPSRPRVTRHYHYPKRLQGQPDKSVFETSLLQAS